MANRSIRYRVTQRSFETEASSSVTEQRSVTGRNSGDIDFDDVFGGPPRWTRYSYGGYRTNSWMESTSSRGGSAEKQVSGEQYSSPRRCLSYDFFDDIFRRRDDHDSRALSSARFERLGTSIPDEFNSSMPAKMTRTVDIPVFGSTLQTQIHRSNSGQTHGQTVLSRVSSSVNESPLTRSIDNETDHKSKPRTESPGVKFHFSIHKWASVGVPLLMSTLTGSSKVSALSIDNLQDCGLQNEDISAGKEDMNTVSEISLMEEVIEKEPLAVKQETNNSEVIHPSSILHTEIERKGYEEAGMEAGTEERMETANGKIKLEAKTMNSSNKAEANKSDVGSPNNRVNGMIKDLFKMSNQENTQETEADVSFRWMTGARTQIQEDVADLISYLNANVEIVTDASKTMKLASDLPADSVKMATNASVSILLDSKMPAENVNIMPDASFKAIEEAKRSNKQKFAQNLTLRKLEDINFQKDASPASKSSVETIDDLSLDRFQVEELTPADDKHSKTQEHSDAIMEAWNRLNSLGGVIH